MPEELRRALRYSIIHRPDRSDRELMRLVAATADHVGAALMQSVRAAVRLVRAIAALG